MSRGGVGAGLGLGALLAAPAAAQADDFTVTNLNDDGAGSLRQVIELANVDATADRVLFKSKLSGEIALTGGELYIDTPIEVVGPGARTLAVSGEGDSRIFRILTPVGTDVEISGLTLTGGDVTGGPTTQGGAIYVTHTDFTLSDATVSGNSAGIGGGVYAYESNARIVDSTIVGNSAPEGSGGGIFTFDEMEIENSTISGNSAEEGGGLHAFQRDVTIRNSTIARNTASDDVGGVFDVYGDTTVVGSIIADNTAPEHPDFSNTLEAAFSLIGHVSGPAMAEEVVDTVPGSNLLNVDPKLKRLKNNGGPTDTHALKKKSKAKNKVPKDARPKFDQRGAKRKGKGDIGAYELVRCEGVVVNRVGTGKKDKLKGTKKKDGILGLGGNDVLRGKKGRDGLCGGRGKDKLIGGPGVDKLDGGPGKDKEIQ